MQRPAHRRAGQSQPQQIVSVHRQLLQRNATSLFQFPVQHGLDPVDLLLPATEFLRLPHVVRPLDGEKVPEILLTKAVQHPADALFRLYPVIMPLHQLTDPFLSGIVEPQPVHDAVGMRRETTPCPMKCPMPCVSKAKHSGLPIS